MNITATIRNSPQQNDITVETAGSKKTIGIPGKPTGQGSAVNGGELLFLALATCCCNDIYREAARRNIDVQAVEVTVSGQFGHEGETASSIQYQVTIESNSPQADIQALVEHVDRVAEVHNTLRQGVPVQLARSS